jgi:hypothetical protein
VHAAAALGNLDQEASTEKTGLGTCQREERLKMRVIGKQKSRCRRQSLRFRLFSCVSDSPRWPGEELPKARVISAVMAKSYI